MKSVPDTKFQESLRRLHLDVGRVVQKTLRRAYGTITAVDRTKNRVKVTLDDGREAAGGALLRLKNAPLEIIHRFGELRTGLRVEVLYAGEAEEGASAELIGSEGDGPDALLVPNDISKNTLYKMFT